jgi:purine-binding chemotaxis protein CheW
MTAITQTDASSRELARVHEILKERARALARVPAKETDEELLEFVRVTVAGESYGLDTTLVEEVMLGTALTQLPCTPVHVTGIIARRGEILSVVDLRPLLGLPLDGQGAQIVVLSDGRMEFGLLVDAVTGVEVVPVSRLQRKVGVLSGMRADFLQGVTENGVAILDVLRILRDRALVVDESP